MQTEKLVIAIDKLEVSEKLTVVEDVWNDIGKKDGPSGTIVSR